VRLVEISERSYTLLLNYFECSAALRLCGAERTIEHNSGGEQIESEPKNESGEQESLANINRSISEVKNILRVVGELV